MDKKQVIELAKSLRKIASELNKLAKEEPQLFDSIIKEKIISNNKQQTEYLLQAQEVYSEWAILYFKRFNINPVLDKKPVYRIAQILSRKTHSKQQIISALRKFFKNCSLYNINNKYSISIFINNINQYLEYDK